MSFSRPFSRITSHSKPLALHQSTLPPFRCERTASPERALEAPEQRSNLQLTLAVLTALGIVLFPAVLGLS